MVFAQRSSRVVGCCGHSHQHGNQSRYEKGMANNDAPGRRFKKKEETRKGTTLIIKTGSRREYEQRVTADSREVFKGS